LSQFWASPFADATGRAGVNQARFAVLAIRLSSLTLLLSQRSTQASGWRADNSATRHRLAPFIFAKRKWSAPSPRCSSRLLAGAETARALSRVGAAGLRSLWAFAQGPLGACLRSRVPVASL